MGRSDEKELYNLLDAKSGFCVQQIRMIWQLLGFNAVTHPECCEFLTGGVMFGSLDRYARQGRH